MFILAITLKSGAKEAVAADDKADFKDLMDSFSERMDHVYALPGGTFAVRLSEVACLSIVETDDPGTDQAGD